MNRDTVSNWKELSALYEQADELDAAALAPWLAELRSTQHPLLSQLERLLQAREHLLESDFLAAPPRLKPTTSASASEWHESQMVGTYRLVRALGSGGMAEVWLAAREDAGFSRDVAIKLLYRHPLGPQRDSMEQRFRRERDILASLTHPHIASLLDAGVTSSGQPWLALEYVQGQPLTGWCDENRLDLAARVRLFLQVLTAVQHAHANLIIHRDLKPANILVTSEGQVQLLDFGIAKLLEPDSSNTTESELTRVGGQAMTPRYASPEQLSGRPLSTVSDLYSLGVVMYELLCGESAYELKLESAAQLESAILENAVRAPSRRTLSAQAAAARSVSVKALHKTLNNDLDAIVLKAMHRQPQLRYASAEALRTDLQRWLDGEPVQAKVPSFAYWLRKFVQRNRWSVGLGAGAIVSLVAVTAVAVVLGFQARAESKRATAARDFLIKLFAQADPDLSHGKVVSAKELLDQGNMTILSTLGEQPLLQADLLRGLGDAQANMSDYKKADVTLGNAVVAYQQLGLTQKVAEALVEQAAARYRSGDYPSAADMLGRADTVYRQKDAGAEVMARYYEVLSWVQLEHGTLPLALVASQKALALSTQVFGENHKKTIEALSAFARVEVKMGNFEAAIQHLQDALTRSDHASGVTPLETLAIHSDISRAEFNAGRFAAVADRLQAQAPRCEQLVDPQGESCVGLRQRQAVALLLLGQHKEALALLPALLPMTANTESPNRAAEAMIAACRVLTLNDRPQDHLQLWVALRVLGDSGPEVKQREAVKIQALWVQAEMLLHAGKPLAAQGILQRAETRATNANDRRATARLHLMQGMAWQSQGQFELALRELRTGAQEYAKLVGENHPITLLVTANQVRSLWAVQRSGEALALLDHAMPVLQDALGYQAPTFLKLRALRDTVARTPIPDSPAARKVDFFL